MSRAPRIDVPGLIYHVYNRGIRKLPIFHDESDRHKFLDFLKRSNREYPFRLHAYCLMSNHFHLLIQTLDHSLSKTMHLFKTLFSGWFNYKYGTVGPVFQSRFHSIPVQKDAYFTTVARYIHLNPVRAGMVERPEDYLWSDFGRLMRGEPDELVDSSFLLGYFGHERNLQRQQYKQFVYDLIGKAEPITEQVLLKMRSWGKISPQARMAASGQSQELR